ncbi:hypothetical protein [Galbitalea soli]|uniref:Uncharacterized protein n=1 Tax=Galbitalea soli TaxID=1268042 RepID=A0A7C9PP95_9MICO|nr:hypothetical protein [Galbitalea soli]NEM92213.1 hypothetical protein [Galbitalea soli]NYJ31833.1 hypothetical protein [Galbitalea soli]
MSATPPLLARRFWREPTSLLPLRWGSYRGRYLGGLLFIIAGYVLLDGSNTYTVPFLLLGTVLNVTGWLVLPAVGARRLAIVGPALVFQWILLTGPQSVVVMVVPFLGWLLVRQRPALSYLSALLVVAVGIACANVFTTSQGEAASYGITAASVVAAAWLGRWIATRRPPVVIRPRTEKRPTPAG